MSSVEDPSTPSPVQRKGYLSKAKDRFSKTADALKQMSVMTTSDNITSEQVDSVKSQLSSGGAYISTLGGWLLVTLAFGVIVWAFAIIPSIYLETRSAGSLLFLYNLAPVVPYVLGLVIGILAFSNQEVFTEIAGAGLYITYGVTAIAMFLQFLGAVKFGYLWSNALAAHWINGTIVPTIDVRAISSTLYTNQSSIIIGTIATCVQVSLYPIILFICYLISRGTTGLNHWIDVWAGMDISTKSAGIAHMIDSEFADTNAGYSLITSHINDIATHVDKYVRNGRHHALNTYHHAPHNTMAGPQQQMPQYAPMQHGQQQQPGLYPPPTSNSGYY